VVHPAHPISPRFCGTSGEELKKILAFRFFCFIVRLIPEHGIRWHGRISWGACVGVSPRLGVQQRQRFRVQLCQQLCEQLRQQRPEQLRLPCGVILGGWLLLDEVLPTCGTKCKNTFRM